MKIVWTRLAIGDLQAIRHHVALDDVRAAARVSLRILRATRCLSETPQMGRPGRVINTRDLVLVDLPYIVPYRVTSGIVEVLRVLHTSRKWPKRL